MKALKQLPTPKEYWLPTVHLHGYQPNRINPFTGTLDHNETDWGDVIADETYAPLGCTPIYGGGREVLYEMNVYRLASFDIGPTLAQYLRQHRPAVLQRMIEGNLQAVHETGYPNAAAQAFNHTILPLGTDEHIQFQIAAGLEAHLLVFKHPAKVMWIGECAVSDGVLKALVRNGVEGVILAPNQAQSWRDGTGDWQYSPVDTRQPHLCNAEGSKITVFFRNEEISAGMAFQGLLSDGNALFDRMLGSFRWEDFRQIVMPAVDMETAGHHVPYGNLGLAHALHRLSKWDGLHVTNPAEIMAHFPAQREVMIRPLTSWSCCHGLGRWSRNCGCWTGLPGRHQEWRRPLRVSLDFAYKRVVQVWNSVAPRFFPNPDAALMGYVAVWMGMMSDTQFLSDYAYERIGMEALELARMRFMAEFSLTSCGWFFEEVTRPEPAANLRFAKVAMDLAARFDPERCVHLEEDFLLLFEGTVANYELLTGREIWQRYVLDAKSRAEREGLSMAA
jgi:hypothetical protein